VRDFVEVFSGHGEVSRGLRDVSWQKETYTHTRKRAWLEHAPYDIPFKDLILNSKMCFMFFFQPRHLFPIFRLPARQDYEGPQWIFVWMNGPLTSHVLQDLGALVATNFIASVTLWHTFSIQVEPITWWKRCKKAKHQRCIVLPNRAFLF
jgi:hypothetical protein